MSDLLNLELKNEAAIFDFDGTILNGDCSEEMFKELMAKDLISNFSLKKIGLIPEDENSDPLEYYEKLLSLQKDEDYVVAHLWMVEALAGLKIEDVVKASATAFDQKVLSFEPDILNILNICQQKEANCYILSASPEIIVKYLTEFYLNPFLTEKGLKPFPLKNVNGVETKFNEQPDFSIRDNKINWQKNAIYTLKQDLIYPAPSGEGKSLFIKKHLDLLPGFTISDSLTDIPLLRDSKFGVLFKEKELYIYE